MRVRHGQARWLAAATLLMGLTACSSDLGELQQWMEEQRRASHPTVRPLVPPKKFLPQAYEAQNGVDPFSTQKLSVAIKQESAQPNSVLAAEMNRRREPLESFPLDSMSMVGSLTRSNDRYALLKVDNLLYQVKSGDYLGLNFGRVTKISETDITLREVVQDAAGEWVERTSTLQLQEKGR
jgi:type IV pilus assembly protein PilP